MEKLIGSLPEKEQASSLEIVKSNPIEYNVEISLEHEHLYVAGRYLKFSRQLPQTPWIMNGVVSDTYDKKTSVQTYFDSRGTFPIRASKK